MSAEREWLLEYERRKLAWSEALLELHATDGLSRVTGDEVDAAEILLDEWVLAALRAAQPGEPALRSLIAGRLGMNDDALGLSPILFVERIRARCQEANAHGYMAGRHDGLADAPVSQGSERRIEGWVTPHAAGLYFVDRPEVKYAADWKPVVLIHDAPPPASVEDTMEAFAEARWQEHVQEASKRRPPPAGEAGE